MSNVINFGPTPSVIELGFSWTPAGTFTFTAPGGAVISAPSAAINTALQFTAATTITLGDAELGPLTIVEYRWDFGDGVFGWGNPALHTYQVANPYTQAVLRVTDSKGRHWFTRAQMYLT